MNYGLSVSQLPPTTKSLSKEDNLQKIQGTTKKARQQNLNKKTRQTNMQTSRKQEIKYEKKTKNCANRREGK